MYSNLYFKGNIILNGKIKCETGLYIGDSKDNLEIGGIDSMVIRDKISNMPYIPGSSLKGKLRSLLELSTKESIKTIIKNEGSACNCGNCPSCKLFGFTIKDDEGEFIGPTRTIFRDSFLTGESKDLLKNNSSLTRGTELKMENSIDRIKSTASSPRSIERVPRGAEFNFEIVFSIYSDDDLEIFDYLPVAMCFLEDNYLGGSGTRGYGKIHFKDIELEYRGIDFYKEESDGKTFKKQTFKKVKDIPKVDDLFE